MASKIKKIKELLFTAITFIAIPYMSVQFMGNARTYLGETLIFIFTFVILSIMAIIIGRYKLNHQNMQRHVIKSKFSLLGFIEALLTVFITLYISYAVYNAIYDNNGYSGEASSIIGLLVTFIGLLFIYKRNESFKLLQPQIEWLSKIYNNYSKDYLPIQKKLFNAVIISGGLFFVVDLFAFIEFSDLYISGSSFANQYLQRNFMFPHPYLLGITGIYPISNYSNRWTWYSDEVFLFGGLFLITILFFIGSVVLRRTITESLER